MKIAGLFWELFPNEHFDVFTSPDRVHQVLRRTRQSLKNEKLPIEIVENEGTYCLKITGPLAIAIPLHRKKIGAMESHLYKLQSSSNANTVFTARLAQDRLGLSKAMVSKFLHWAVENGKLERLDSTNRTISYRIVGDAAKSHQAVAS